MQHFSGFGRTVWFAALCLFTIRLSTAQVSTGSIAGQVTDQSHAVVPSITVTLINEGTQAQRSVVTGSDGNYLFPLVAPGFYRIRVATQGFKTYEVKGLGSAGCAGRHTRDLARGWRHGHAGRDRRFRSRAGSTQR